MNQSGMIIKDLFAFPFKGSIIRIMSLTYSSKDRGGLSRFGDSGLVNNYNTHFNFKINDVKMRIIDDFDRYRLGEILSEFKKILDNNYDIIYGNDKIPKLGMEATKIQIRFEFSNPQNGKILLRPAIYESFNGTSEPGVIIDCLAMPDKQNWIQSFCIIPLNVFNHIRYIIITQKISDINRTDTILLELDSIKHKETDETKNAIIEKLKALDST